MKRIQQLLLSLSLCGSWEATAQTSLPTSQPSNETNTPLDPSPRTPPTPELTTPTTPTPPKEEHKTPLSFDGKKRPWTVAVLPLPVASSDSGFGGAVQANIYDHRKNILPYRALYEMLALYSSKGVQAYAASFDRPGLGQYRLKMQAAYFKDPNQYYGLGNESVRDPEIEATGVNESDFRFYGVNLLLRRTLMGPLQLVGALESRRYLVDAPPGSLVLQEQPSGIEGNVVNQLGIALFRDTRDNESNATKGSFYELSLRGGPPGINVHPYLGASFIAKHHLTFGPDITLASRFVLDGLFGDAPFTVQDKFGVEGVYSLGGGRSLRGYPEGRYLGKIKTLVNLELRALPFSTTIRGLHFDLGAAAFLDAGRVLTDINTPLNGLNIHTGIGAGLRILYERDFLVRFDMAHSDEDVVRFYLDVGHIF